jgi:predicted dehydrogenase
MAGGVLAGPLTAGLFAAGSDLIRVGIVGCGGRGTGAAANALRADQNVQLVAMADAFGDRLESSLASLRGSDVSEKVAVPSDRKHVGFDAYRKVIDSDIDVVLLTAPPHFRPEHLKYAVEKGKHVFAEKPVAVDGPGVRSVFETSRAAREKNLAIVSGLCWRYDHGMRATFEKLRDGAAGEIVAIQATYHSSTLKKFPRQPGWSDMEFQLRNWQHMVWASGDFNVEQHVHSLDKVAWAMGDVPPVQCVGSGGRQARTGPESGNVYDHFSVVYEYANGVKAFCSCRQIDGCDNDVSDHVFGTKGVCDVFKHQINVGGKPAWRFRGNKGDMYQTEHNELFASIRNGAPINNGDYMTKSTLMAIMGRMSAYTGKVVTWEQALESKEDLSPPKYDWIPLPEPVVAVPGVTPFA